MKVNGLEKQLLEAIRNKPDHRDLLSLRNWIIGTILTTGLGILALTYTFLMNGSDRSESGVSEGMEIGRSLGQQQVEIEHLKDLNNGQVSKPSGSSGKR